MIQDLQILSPDRISKGRLFPLDPPLYHHFQNNIENDALCSLLIGMKTIIVIFITKPTEYEV